MQSVDHTKLHNQIVQKAFDVSSAVLTESQKAQLFQNKIQGAQALLNLQTRTPVATRTER